MAGPLRAALSTRNRRLVRALGEALFHHDAGPRPEQLDALVDGFDAHLGAVSPALRRPLLAALELLRWLPILLLIAVRTFDDLDVAARLRLLERMERSRAAILLMPLLGFKTVLSLAFFEDPSELRAMGYAGDGTRKRWLTIAA
jgi:hypothetical protein